MSQETLKLSGFSKDPELEAIRNHPQRIMGRRRVLFVEKAWGLCVCDVDESGQPIADTERSVSWNDLKGSQPI